MINKINLFYYILNSHIPFYIYIIDHIIYGNYGHFSIQEQQYLIKNSKKIKVSFYDKEIIYKHLNEQKN